jgi:hypothetical protein
MKHSIKVIQGLSLLFLCWIILYSCQKEIKNEPVAREEISSSSPRTHGHLQQTNTFSSEVVKRWLQVQVSMLFNPASKTPAVPLYGLNVNRWMAYCGVALYESVVGGMPAYQSLNGQLNQMPEMPKTEPGKAYHWPTCANTALAEVTRKLFGLHYNSVTGDALEQELNTLYQSEIDNPATFERSVNFGKAVAKKIVEWAATDRPWLTWPAYQFPTYQLGDWRVATPPANGVAYWGFTRTIVPGSIDNVASPKMQYSESLSSQYYMNMKEVYDVSNSLTFPQRLQAWYYDDPASLLPTGASYYGVLKQVIEQLKPALDIAALTYAKAGMSLMDATIGSFKAKFTYLTERPFQFIQRVINPAWVSLIPTPGHPDHPSNHAVFSSSFAHALTTIYGDNVVFSNNIYEGVMKDIGGGYGLQNLGTRHYSSFYDMMNDISYSRLYGGIHTRYACEEGMKQGRKTAENIDNIVTFHTGQ